MTVAELVEEGIGMNRDARNTYGAFAAFVLIASVPLFVFGNEVAPIAVVVGCLFGAVHAELLRRKLVAARQQVRGRS